MGRLRSRLPLFGKLTSRSQVPHSRQTPLVLVAFFGLFIALAAGCAGNKSGDATDEAADMAALHDGDEPMATDLAKEPTKPVSTSNVVYGRIDGTPLNGYMATPEDEMGALPGIIMIHEWWGLNDNIKTMARRLAGEGYRVLAVDLYNGQVAADPNAAQMYMREALANQQSLTTNLRSANAFLRENQSAPRVGVIGWCFGGGQSANAMVAMPSSIDATVIYYGNLPTDREALAAVESPVIGFFGEDDGGIPVSGVRQFESTMNELGKNVTVNVYGGAGHAFANPSGTNYVAEAASDAWSKTLRFLAEELKTTS